MAAAQPRREASAQAAPPLQGLRRGPPRQLPALLRSAPAAAPALPGADAQTPSLRLTSSAIGPGWRAGRSSGKTEKTFFVSTSQPPSPTPLTRLSGSKAKITCFYSVS